MTQQLTEQNLEHWFIIIGGTLLGPVLDGAGFGAQLHVADKVDHHRRVRLAKCEDIVHKFSKSVSKPLNSALSKIYQMSENERSNRNRSQNLRRMTVLTGTDDSLNQIWNEKLSFKIFTTGGVD